jgi:hypothetical protein
MVKAASYIKSELKSKNILCQAFDGEEVSKINIF